MGRTLIPVKYKFPLNKLYMQRHLLSVLGEGNFFLDFERTPIQTTVCILLLKWAWKAVIFFFFCAHDGNCPRTQVAAVATAFPTLCQSKVLSGGSSGWFQM